MFVRRNNGTHGIIMACSPSPLITSRNPGHQSAGYVDADL
jgi:hypothetical protein